MPTIPKLKRTYTPVERGVALATLEAHVRAPRTFRDATNEEFELAAKFAHVDVAAMRFWAAGGELLDVDGAARNAAQRANIWDGVSRPMPPEDMWDEGRYPQRLVPAPEMWEWAKATFVVPGSPLQNPVHAHLNFATVGVLWSNYPKKKQGQIVAGFCEMPPAAKGLGAGQREDFQLRSWFGQIPHFMITLDSVFWAEYSDRNACALIEHELGHAGQAKDPWGTPRWDKKGPVLTLAPHTVQEFDFVAERYGIAACAAGTREFVEAAARGPIIDDDRIAISCGNCRR